MHKWKTASCTLIKIQIQKVDQTTTRLAFMWAPRVICFSSVTARKCLVLKGQRALGMSFLLLLLLGRNWVTMPSTAKADSFTSSGHCGRYLTCLVICNRMLIRFCNWSWIGSAFEMILWYDHPLRGCGLKILFHFIVVRCVNCHNGTTGL